MQRHVGDAGDTAADRLVYPGESCWVTVCRSATEEVQQARCRNVVLQEEEGLMSFFKLLHAAHELSDHLRAFQQLLPHLDITDWRTQ